MRDSQRGFQGFIVATKTDLSLTGCVAVAVGALGVLVIGWFLVGAVLGYWFEPVDSREIAVQFKGNQPVQVVGPGLYTDLSPFAEIKRVKIGNIPFCAVDPEVIASDSQALGVHITGDVRRPGLENQGIVLSEWSRLSTYWTDETALLGDGKCQSGLMSNLARQAAKVCVGGKPAMQSVIGEARDTFRQCVDENLDDLVQPYGLTVENIIVPNVELSQAVRQAMDNITNARYAVQLAEQESLKARADAERDLAVKQGQIRVTEGQSQEQARQRVALAEITRAQLQAEQAVIQQTADNNLLQARTSLEIERVKAEAAAETARAQVATEAARATLFQANPAYANSQNIEKASAAFKAGDKFVLSEGVDPTVIIGDTQPVTPVGGR